MMRIKATAFLAFGALSLAACAQVEPKSPEEIAALARYDGTWEVEAVLVKDNVAEFEGMRNVVACGAWIKQTWTVASGEISGPSHSPGNKQSVSGAIAADGSWGIRVKTANGYSYPGHGAIRGDEGAGTLQVEWGRGRTRQCEYELTVTRAGA